MRTHYDLSPETLAVLTDRVSEIAAEMDCNKSYLYQILSNAESDSFAKFLRLFSAAVRAGAPVCHWTNKLAAVVSRYEKSHPQVTAIECLADKIRTDADTTSKLVDALKDGRVSRIEAERILTAIAEERKVLELIETMMLFNLAGETRGFAKTAVNGRKVQ